MIVITRRIGESVVIGNVVVRINDILESRVKLGIEAPPNVKVLRQELLNRKNKGDESDVSSSRF